MFGLTKREKNEKSQNKGKAILGNLSDREKGKKLSRLRRRYPGHLIYSSFDFAGELFDMDIILLSLLLIDDCACAEADIYDNPEPEVDLVDTVEAAIVADAAVVAEVEEQGDSPDQSSFDSSTPVESSPVVESTPETTSFDSDTTSSYGGGGDYDSGGSFDSGGGDD